MVSHSELGSDPPIGPDRELGCDKAGHLKCGLWEDTPTFVDGPPSLGSAYHC